MLDKIEIGKTSVSVTRGLIKRKGVREKNSFFFEQFSACSLVQIRGFEKGSVFGQFFSLRLTCIGFQKQYLGGVWCFQGTGRVGHRNGH